MPRATYPARSPRACWDAFPWRPNQGGEWQRNRDTGQRLGNRDKIAGRGQLEWKPADLVDLRLGFHLAQDKSDETGLHLLKPYTRTNALGVVTTTIQRTRRDTSRMEPQSGLREPDRPHPGFQTRVDNSNNGVDLTANLDLGGAKITSISATTG